MENEPPAAKAGYGPALTNRVNNEGSVTNFLQTPFYGLLAGLGESIYDQKPPNPKTLIQNDKVFFDGFR